MGRKSRSPAVLELGLVELGFRKVGHTCNRSHGTVILNWDGSDSDVNVPPGREEQQGVSNSSVNAESFPCAFSQKPSHGPNSSVPSTLTSHTLESWGWCPVSVKTGGVFVQVILCSR